MTAGKFSARQKVEQPASSSQKCFTNEATSNKKLEEAVSLFLEDKRKEAKEALRAALGFHSTLALAEDVIAALKSPRPWRTLFETRNKEIVEVAGDVQTTIAPKFGLVTSGTPNNLDAYKELVLRDLGQMGVEIKAALDSTRTSTEAIAAAQHSATGKDAKLFSSFHAFAHDLNFDLYQQEKAVAEALKRGDDIQSMARLYDAVAEQWRAYQTATQFVHKLAADLGHKFGDG